jgi:predicted DNA-binding transcriptional regulator AlpA
MTDLVKLAEETPAAELPHLLGQLREAEATAMARLCTAPPATTSAAERLLTVEEAAARLGASTDWLYRHWRQLPFARKLPYGLRFSESGLNAYIRNGHK